MRLRLLLVPVLAILASAAAQAPVGFLPVSAARILSITGVPVPRATLCAQVTYGSPSGASVNPAGGGQTTRPKQCVEVINGAFTINLPDTRLGLPHNVCVAVTITDPAYNSLLGPGYDCLQPTSAAGSNWCSLTSCNFDLYHPASPALVAVSPGPLGPQGFPGPAGPQGLPGHCSDGTTLCPVSVSEAWVSQIGCAQGADLSTGFTYGTTTPATDAGPCISAWLNSHVKFSVFALLHQDGTSLVSGIHGPTGGWGIDSGIVPGMALVTITGCTIASAIVTCNTLPSTLSAGQGMVLNGFTVSGFMNRQKVVVLSSGLSSTQFQVPANQLANYSGANAIVEAGVGQILTGNGFYQAYGTNNDVINNTTPAGNCVNGFSDPGWTTPGPAPSRGSGILLRNLAINGNKGDGYSGNSTTGQTQGSGTYQTSYQTTPYCSYMGVNLMNVNNVLLDHLYLYNYSAYGFRFMNAGNFEASHVTCDPMGLGVVPYAGNNDCGHISAPANDGWFHHLLSRSGDDTACICADEGWVGEITRVMVSDTVYDGALSAGRIIVHSTAWPAGDAQPKASYIRFTGGAGTVGGSFFNIGDEGTHTQTVQHSMSHIRIDHNDLLNYSPYYAVSGDKIAENIDDLSFDHESRAGLPASPGYSPFTTYNNSTINLFQVDHYTQKRTGSANSTSAPFDLRNATIGQMDVIGFKVADVDGGSYGQIPYVVSNNPTTTIAHLTLQQNDMSNITTEVADPTRVALLTSDASYSNLGGTLSVANVVPGPGLSTSGGGATAGSINTVSGLDGSHNILFTTGSAPTGGGILFTTTFTGSRRHPSYCTPTPTSNTAAALTGAVVPILVSGSPLSYSFYAGSAGLAPSTQYSYSVICP